MSGEVAHALQSRHAKPHKCSQAICHLVQPWVQRPKGPATKHHISCLRRLRDRRDYSCKTTLRSTLLQVFTMEPVRHVVRGAFGFLGPRPARPAVNIHSFIQVFTILVELEAYS